MAQQRTRTELLELFEEHLQFLERSNDAFDQGHLSEAKRMAVSLRVLFHNTKLSHALLNQVDLHKTLTWVDTAGIPDPNNLLPTWGLVHSGIKIEDGKGTPFYEAPLGNYPPMTRIRTKTLRLLCGSRIQFEDWWTEHVVKDADRTLFSRKDFVLALVNKEGGAHVDPEIQESYNKIANLNSLGWTYSEGPEGQMLTGPLIPVGPGGSELVSSSAPTKPQKAWTDPIALDNPVPHMVRQISYEVVESVKQQRERIK